MSKREIEREWESPRESAEATGLSRQEIYNAIGRGELDARKWGSRTIINVESRRSLMASLPKAVVKVVS